MLHLTYAIWLFFVLLLAPDKDMPGYRVNNQVGTWKNTIFRRKGVAIVVYLSGMLSGIEELPLAGIVMFGHTTMDSALGNGLKYDKGFKFTHLETVGKKNG